MILITSVDEYLGYCITAHLSSISSIRPYLRVVYSKERQKYSYKKTTVIQKSPWLLTFASKGIDVREVDYMHPNDMSHAMRNVDQIILSLDSYPNRVERCKYICEVAVRSHVRSIIFLSHVGATTTLMEDENGGYQALSDYGRIENHLVQLQEEGEKDMPHCTILRLDWLQQHFHLWSFQTEATRTIALPLFEDVKICPIDISDVCQVIFRLVTDDNGNILTDLKDSHSGQVYILAGPCAMTVRDIVGYLKEATEYQNFGLKDKTITQSIDTGHYLKHLSQNLRFDKRLKMDRIKAYQDNLDGRLAYRNYILWSPTDLQIQTYLDYFDCVNKTSASVDTNTIEFLLRGYAPRTLRNFFFENAISFKPRV
ncbi:hypothetical protein BDF20DRAFT_880918 [Mycotypha africana]|uniref:uncharacterized protein n=1 Tax=Mycotypha africana TaxID=64632 RepID=UPI002301B839|nr:uncharacterized protein BDF20DRAFT_880918 [Mycotypha africana]KAI8973194.1 hypothetical protein BDF20DRAFT_880918 [Mycotypha africana]